MDVIKIITTWTRAIIPNSFRSIDCTNISIELIKCIIDSIGNIISNLRDRRCNIIERILRCYIRRITTIELMVSLNVIDELFQAITTGRQNSTQYKIGTYSREIECIHYRIC